MKQEIRLRDDDGGRPRNSNFETRSPDARTSRCGKNGETSRKQSSSWVQLNAWTKKKKQTQKITFFRIGRIGRSIYTKRMADEKDTTMMEGWNMLCGPSLPPRITTTQHTSTSTDTCLPTCNGDRDKVRAGLPRRALGLRPPKKTSTKKKEKKKEEKRVSRMWFHAVPVFGPRVTCALAPGERLPSGLAI